MRCHFTAFVLLACLGCTRTPPDEVPPAEVPPALSPDEASVERDDPGPGIGIDYQNGDVTRRDDSGRVLWNVKRLSKLTGAARQPLVLHDAERIYLGQDDGITALDTRSGEVVWQGEGS